MVSGFYGCDLLQGPQALKMGFPEVTTESVSSVTTEPLQKGSPSVTAGHLQNGVSSVDDMLCTEVAPLASAGSYMNSVLAVTTGPVDIGSPAVAAHICRF